MFKRVLTVLCCAAAFLTAALPALAQSQESGALIVKVTDAASGAPIDNATVFLLGGDSPQSSLTNAKGLLIFDPLQPGDYRVQVSAGGYRQTESGDIALGDGERLDVAVKLTPVIRTIASVVAHGSVSVSEETIGEDSAQRKISQTLSDALNKIAGVNADTSLYGADSAFNISLRGANASQTAYSVNGMHMGGAAGQALSPMQDLFSGSSVDFTPTAESSAGRINFFTALPTKLWSYSFTGTAGNYSNTLGTWTVSGGGKKIATTFEHAAGGQDYPLSGMTYADQTGQTYEHVGGYSRASDLFRTNITLSPVSAIHYTFMSGSGKSSPICANDTTLLPCGNGPGTNNQANSSIDTIGFSTLASHVQINVYTNMGHFANTVVQPNRAIGGVTVPLDASSSGTWRNVSLYASSTAGHHTITGGGFAMTNASRASSSYNGVTTLQTSLTQRFASYTLADRVKSSDKLALNHMLSFASGTDTGNSIVFDESATWQPKRSDAFEASVGFGSAYPSGTFRSVIGDPQSADFDCHNGSVFVNGPSDLPSKQSSLQYDLSWRHSFKGGFVTANLYRNDFTGESMRAGVPFGIEPPSIFPNGPAAYLNQIQHLWSQPAVCGSVPFDPQRVYVSQMITGLGQVAQGFDVSGQVPIGKRVMLFPRYVVTNSYISTLDPRLIAPGSYYAPGAQIPHTPLHTAGLIVDGIVPYIRAEWLLDGEYTSANNGNNLPGYTIYNAGLVFNTERGSLRFFLGNVFGSHTGLFTTYHGVDPMPLQGGGTFAYSTTPLPPRSFSVMYTVRWHQHESPPKRTPPAKGAAKQQ